MSKWAWMVLFLAAVNALLAYAYFSKTTDLNFAIRQIQMGPPVDDYLHSSEQVVWLFSRSYRADTKIVYDKLVAACLRLDKHITNLNGNAEIRSEAFDKKGRVPLPQQDSLWISFREYRAAVDDVLGKILPERRLYRQRHLAGLGIAGKARQPMTTKEKRLLQLRLDSMVAVTFSNIPLQVDDSVQLSNFTSYLGARSNPADELRMNTVLNKLDNFFLTKDKLSMYGRVYALRDVTEAEQRNLYRHAVILKSKVDDQLYKMGSR